MNAPGTCSPGGARIRGAFLRNGLFSPERPVSTTAENTRSNVDVAVSKEGDVFIIYPTKGLTRDAPGPCEQGFPYAAAVLGHTSGGGTLGQPQVLGLARCEYPEIAAGPGGSAFGVWQSGTQIHGAAFTGTANTPETLPPLQISVAAGQIHLQFNGSPGELYQLEQATADLSTWTPLAPSDPPANTIDKSVPFNPAVSKAFFRVRRVESP